MRRAWIVFLATVVAYGCESPRREPLPTVPLQDAASIGEGHDEAETPETADAELERLVTTREWPDERDRPFSAEERLARRGIVLAARARAEADVAAGEPRIVTYGLRLSDEDIDSETGFPFHELG